MADFTADLVLDVPAGLRKENDFFIFGGGVELKAVGCLRGLGVVRLIISSSDLRRRAREAYDPFLVERARVRYPFLFLGAGDTNPLLYREF